MRIPRSLKKKQRSMDTHDDPKIKKQSRSSYDLGVNHEIPKFSILKDKDASR